VFIDELDAVGGKRGLGVTDEHCDAEPGCSRSLISFERRPQVVSFQCWPPFAGLTLTDFDHCVPVHCWLFVGRP
jgi:hypothetical protein